MTAKNKFEIRSSEYPYDMSAWCAEKSSNVLRSLSEVADLLNSENDLPPDFRDEISRCLGSAVIYGILVLAFSRGQATTAEPGADAEEIMSLGYAGYERLAVRYGLLEMTSEERRRMETRRLVESCARQLHECLTADRASGRTAAHDVLARYANVSPVLTGLADSLEQVTMGESSWEDFVKSARIQLDYLLEKHDE